MTRRLRHMFAALVAAGLCWGTSLAAQGSPSLPPATLIADNISFDGSSSVAANGSVEVFYNGVRLRAQSITFDGAADSLRVEGPLTLVDAAGNTRIVAEFAELSGDLQNGVLQSARLVLDRQLQIAATQIDRTDGRYTQLYQAVASSCEVCFENPTPIWEIRARRVIHDQVEQQLYFDNATFRVLGIPVFYLPRMRLPDPTVERANGFLAPSIRVDETTGTQIRVPYFIMLGDHADVTVTPWIGTGTQTMEIRYRHAFRNGRLNAYGAVSWDDLTNEDIRGYLFSDATFRMGGGFILNLQAQAVSDRTYLATYDFPNPEILESFARISRVQRDEYIEAHGTLFQSLRAGVDNEVLPTRVAHAEITRRFSPAFLGGTLTAALEGTGFYRYSTAESVGEDANGRDVFRVTGELDWRRTEIFGGLETTFQGALHGGVYSTQQGGVLNGTETRLTPYAAIEARYPLQAYSANGVSHIIEPVAQLVWSETYGNEVPNEDSFLVEFDEANLFALDRFPGSDEREVGPRANLGLTYTRTAPTGLSFSLAGGVVLRTDEQGQLTEGSGLNGTQSDFLIAAHVRFNDHISIVNRALFDTDFDFNSSELSFVWTGDRHVVASTFNFLSADIGEQRPEDISEWAFHAGYGLDNGWEAAVNWQYDFIENAPDSARLSLGYENECLDMEVFVVRSYSHGLTTTSSDQFGLTVSLAGFGAGREGRSVSRSCRG